ncbi:sigma-54 interaction domain-containing protein [Bacillus norwichensis]|uniref:Sigma 54-interacting transcriptional regulator n=1 Tax=Bacillus norwichensis TaxID=2762217 RepID=A0ABR8VIF4_9BACI|nr:sigma 54-interacting transcriptional regulator [Bacillus norwichensis]MBD8004534.1 sigma 54-interacting transcriptional regulator [Bacillus norwichensis]
MRISDLGSVFAQMNEGVLFLNKEGEVLYEAGDFVESLLSVKGLVDGTANSIIIEDKAYELKIQKLVVENSPVTMILVNQDVRGTKLAALEQIVDSINQGIMASDSEGRIFIYNKAQEKLENLKKAEVIGKYLWEVYRIDPKTSEHRGVFRTREPIIGQYRAHAYIEGQPQYTTYSTYPLVKNNNSIGAFSICMNDTKLKNLLYETVELKRKLFQPAKAKSETDNGTSFSFEDIKGESSELNKLIKEAQNFAVYNTDVLIVGETGTGKELFAQSIHNFSSRASSPFIAVNCAAIPETLLESTLFGTTKGAYTGAIDQAGLFEYAQNGTLFLDEINSMPMSLQAKLIRVLEERKVRRVGSNRVTAVNCQIITASNEDPQILIKNEKLRLDLYYRIAKACLLIPPLRSRPEDLTFYLRYFINKCNEKFNKQLKGMSKELEELCFRYSWPGNVRELEHVMENIMLRTETSDQYLDVRHVPDYLKVMMESEEERRPSIGQREDSLRSVQKLSWDNIKEELEKTDWNITQAARNFGLSRQNLQYYIKKYNVKREKT